MVNYALRMAQPPVQKVSYTDSIENLKDSHEIFFGYIGDHQDTLWVSSTLLENILKAPVIFSILTTIFLGSLHNTSY